ncbi:MAG: hypothetical protein K2X47_11535, partial [Bdellovibrionales bacterium]|nr:hypothetical protein [Bdellovibrionales bacterium]
APAAYSVFDPHCSFSEFRRLLWSKMQLAETPDQKKAFLKRVLAVIERQVQLQYRRMSSASPEKRKRFPDAEAKAALLAEIQNLY